MRVTHDSKNWWTSGPQLRLEYKKFKPAYPQPVETACKPKDQALSHCK